MAQEKSRMTTRYEFKKDLSKFISNEENPSVRCLSLDVSTQGLCLISFVDLKENTTIDLNLDDQIKLSVKWCKKLTPSSKVCYIGLMVEDESINLLDMFIEAGMVSELVPAQNKISAEELQALLSLGGS